MLLPILVITRQAVIEYLDKVVVVEITTKGKGYPTELFIDQAGNLPLPSFVQTDNLHKIPMSRMIKFAGTLDTATMGEGIPEDRAGAGAGRSSGRDLSAAHRNSEASAGMSGCYTINTKTINEGTTPPRLIHQRSLRSRTSSTGSSFTGGIERGHHVFDPVLGRDVAQYIECAGKKKEDETLPTASQSATGHPS